MKRRYWLLFLASALGGIYLSVMYINPYEGVISLSEMILQLSGSRGDLALGFSFSELISFAMRLFPAFIFELYAGIMLYQHFCTASVYVFSRYTHRVKWYVKEVGLLCGVVCIFHVLLLAAAALTAAFRYEVQVDSAGMVLTMYHFFIYSLWVYSMTLAVNLVALYIGSSKAYTFIMSMQLIGIVLLNLMELVKRCFGNGAFYSGYLVWNPLAHLVLGWHSSNMEPLDQILATNYMKIDLTVSLIVVLLLGIAITITGAVLVKKRDLLVSDLETEAA